MQSMAKMKMTNWEEIFATYSINRGRIYLMYKELLRIKVKTKCSIDKWVKHVKTSQRM